MTWKRKRLHKPAVPDDYVERKIQIALSQAQLRQIQDREPRTDRVANSMQTHVNANHFSDRLGRAFGMGASGR